MQTGLLLGDPAVPLLTMGHVISYELQLLGSHGMAARNYPELLDVVQQGELNLGHLVGRRTPS